MPKIILVLLIISFNIFSENSIIVGKWLISINEDPISDNKIIVFMLDADKGKNIYGNDISLITIFTERTKSYYNIKLYINWRSYLADNTEITIRLDKNNPETFEWSKSTNSMATFCPSDTVESFINKLLGTHNFVARITPYNESAITAIFDVSELKNALKSQNINVNSKNEIVNLPVSLGTVADPVFDILGGEYTDEQKVRITCATEGAKIRYTTWGSDPTTNDGIYYDRPIVIDKSTTLKAIAYKEGWANSKIVTVEYIMKLGL